MDNRSPFFLVLVWMLVVSATGCGSSDSVVEDQRHQAIQIRIHRHTALAGGEVFHVRRTAGRWSGKLVGDGQRFSCFFERELTPRSNWEEFYHSLVDLGLLELEGTEEELGREDGDRILVEAAVGDKRTQYAVDNLAHRDSGRSRQLMRISEMISQEFDTPLFVPDYDRAAVGKYLIDACKERRPADPGANTN